MFSLSDKEKKQELKTQICKILFSGKKQFRLTQPSVILTEIVASKTIWEFIGWRNYTEIWIPFTNQSFRSTLLVLKQQSSLKMQKSIKLEFEFSRQKFKVCWLQIKIILFQ